MTNLRKAAEMALEALEKYSGVDQRACDAEEALQQALAQPEQEPLVWMNKYGHVSSEQTEEYNAPLYTAPPKREWVGLSSLDKTFLRTAYAQLRPLYHDKKEDVSVAAEVVTDWDGFFAAIDAKLKEKNT